MTNIEATRAKRGRSGRFKDWLFHWSSSKDELLKFHSDWVSQIRPTQALLNTAIQKGDAAELAKTEQMMGKVEYKLWLIERALRRKGVNILTTAQAHYNKN